MRETPIMTCSVSEEERERERELMKRLTTKKGKQSKYFRLLDRRQAPQMMTEGYIQTHSDTPCSQGKDRAVRQGDEEAKVKQRPCQRAEWMEVKSGQRGGKRGWGVTCFDKRW